MLVLFLLLLLLPKPVYALTDSGEVTVSASIPTNEVTIFGYTSPNSKTELTSVDTYSLTFSQEDGYFEFNKIILPRTSSEICLQSEDDSHRTTTPTCLPSLPTTNYHTDVGPIILPPTVSLEQDKINPNSTVVSSGQSIPNSPLTIFFYKVEDNAKSFPKEALAYSLPPVKTTTDKNGNYSLNLPTAYSSNYRLYTSVKFDENSSPKSNTLLYTMPSLFWLFLQQNTYLFVLLPFFIITLILFFFLLFFNSSTIYHLRSTIKFLPAIRPSSYPAIKTQHFPHIYPDVLIRNHQIPN